MDKFYNASKMLRSRGLLTAGAYSILRASAEIDIVPSCTDVDRLLDDDDIATVVALSASGVSIGDVPDAVAESAVQGLTKLDEQEGSAVAGQLFEVAADRLTKIGELEARRLLGISAGVPTAANLSKATRRAFHKHHPSNGGSKEALERVKQAYRMLKKSTVSASREAAEEVLSHTNKGNHQNTKMLIDEFLKKFIREANVLADEIDKAASEVQDMTGEDPRDNLRKQIQDHIERKSPWGRDKMSPLLALMLANREFIN